MRFSAIGQLGLVIFFVTLAGIETRSSAATTTAISQCPYTISNAGNYILARDLQSAGTCILIAADGVSIDLQGHTITGNGTGYGITDGGVSVQGILVTAGTVQAFETGIAFDGGGQAVTIAAMVVRHNNDEGIRIFNPSHPGSPSTVIGSTANNNRSNGIRLCCGTVFNSEASGNGLGGIGGGPGLSIQSSSANGNGSSGIGAVGQVINVTANGNGGFGIELDSVVGNSVTASTALQNVGSGIALLCPGTAVSNKALHNGSGNLVETPGLAGQPLNCVNFNNNAP
jgi:hypothetical protein